LVITDNMNGDITIVTIGMTLYYDDNSVLLYLTSPTKNISNIRNITIFGQ